MVKEKGLNFLNRSMVSIIYAAFFVEKLKLLNTTHRNVVVLRRYATSWKFVGSTPDQVINFYLN
jgi:hypothetical protein